MSDALRRITLWRGGSLSSRFHLWFSRLFATTEDRAERRLGELLKVRGIDPRLVGRDALQAHAQVAVALSRSIALMRDTSFRFARDARLEKMADEIADVLLGRRPLNRNIDGLLLAHAPNAAVAAVMRFLPIPFKSPRDWGTPVFSALLIGREAL